MLITQNTNLAADDIVAGDWELIGEVDVPSRSTLELTDWLEVGTYDQSVPPPAIVLDVTPNPHTTTDAFVANLQRVDMGNVYRLVYFFGNYGGPTYRVRAWKHGQ